MISFLKGKIEKIKSNEIILDVNGVGYSVFVTKKIIESLNKTGEDFSLITYLDVKENSLLLYGFFDEKEREIFKMLITVSGISAKTAHTILSYTTFEQIIGIISNKSPFTTVKIPGIGPKKIELISLALKDKIYKLAEKEFEDFTDEKFTEYTNKEQSRLEALNALMNLGYQRSDAEKIIREVLKENVNSDLTTEEIIKKSLNFISKN